MILKFNYVFVLINLILVKKKGFHSERQTPPTFPTQSSLINLKVYTSYAVQILCIGTDRSQQTVQTKVRLLLKKQSDQGLRCLPFLQHLLDALMQCYIKLFYFLDNFGNCLRCLNFYGILNKTFGTVNLFRLVSW